MNDTTKIHPVNGIVVEQRLTDGFINGTAMCVSQKKRINNWLRNEATLELVGALADDLGLEVNYSDPSKSVEILITTCFPELVINKRGDPANGGGTWLHPDLAIQLAQWVSPQFAIQVSRWVRDWLLSSHTGDTVESTEFYRNVHNELKQIKSEVRQIANCYRHAENGHPGLRELIDEYGQDELSIPLGLSNPFTYTEWAALVGFSDCGVNLRRRIAESVKSLRKVKQLKKKNNHVLYYHSDLPAFKAVLEDIKGNGGRLRRLRVVS